MTSGERYCIGHLRCDSRRECAQRHVRYLSEASRSTGMRRLRRLLRAAKSQKPQFAGFSVLAVCVGLAAARTIIGGFPEPETKSEATEVLGVDSWPGRLNASSQPAWSRLESLLNASSRLTRSLHLHRRLSALAGCDMFATCSGHGRCRGLTGQCECYPGWNGTDCGQRTGYFCEQPDFTGVDCDACSKNIFTDNCRLECDMFVDCNGHGRCDGLTGRCLCDSNWQKYHDCSQGPCTNGFTGRSCKLCSKNIFTGECIQ